MTLGVGLHGFPERRISPARGVAQRVVECSLGRSMLGMCAYAFTMCVECMITGFVNTTLGKLGGRVTS